MSNLTNFPTIRPSLLLDFANSKSVDPRITSTRASIATRTNEKGLVETVAANVPRLDFDPATGECKGLLIEEARTNLLTYSDQFDNAAWGKSAASVSANGAAAPDGSVSADKLVEGASTAAHYVYASATSTTNTNAYTNSIYAKAAERSLVNLFVVEGSTYTRNVQCTFNLATGVAGAVSLGGGATGYASIKDVGGGWYRCSVTATLGGSDTSIQVRIRLTDASGNASYTGDGTSGLYIWGAQLEAGAFPTSYIPTTTAAATRAADSASMTGTNFSEWYRADEGMFVVEYILSNITTTCGVMAVSDGTNANRMIVRGGSTGATTFIGVSGGATQYDDSFASGLANVSTLVAFGYKTNAFVGTRNGAAPITDVSCVVPTVSMLRLGADGGGALPLNGHIKRIAYYPVKLSSSQLQALTA